MTSVSGPPFSWVPVATESYDLRCRRGSIELHVEVKGTTTEGTTALLTPNEVSEAHEHPHIALFVLRLIEVQRDEKGSVVGARGGRANRSTCRGVSMTLHSTPSATSMRFRQSTTDSGRTQGSPRRHAPERTQCGTVTAAVKADPRQATGSAYPPKSPRPCRVRSRRTR